MRRSGAGRVPNAARVAFVAALLIVSDCGSRAAESVREPSATGPHWSYRGAAGPAAWGSLAADFGACADGSAQSPIAIDDPEDVALPDVHFDYRTTVAEIRDTGHTEQVSVPPGSWMALDGVAYRLEQLHFHAPSEHIVDGRSYPVEFHFVHRAPDGVIAVAAVMAGEGRENPAWEPIVRRLPAKRTVPVDGLDLSALLPGEVTSARYDGSLTTPPCSEGVHWVLLDRAVELSHRQIGDLTAHYAGNNRPVQDRNGRLVAHDSTRGD
jgi:carbonic anhydrase